jgi:transcriptional regulator of arginine metabolism
MLNDDIITLIKQGMNDQSDLLSKLQELGHNITQSSISRKLKQLGIQKIHGIYQIKQNLKVEMIKVSFVSPNLIVIRTLPGHSGVISDRLDKEFIENDNHPEFIGSIAGDDTIFLAVDLKGKSHLDAIKKINLIIG